MNSYAICCVASDINPVSSIGFFGCSIEPVGAKVFIAIASPIGVGTFISSILSAVVVCYFIKGVGGICEDSSFINPCVIGVESSEGLPAILPYSVIN